MKNIQVIDDALNTVYDIFELSDHEFDLIFPNDTNIAFIDEVDQLEPKEQIFAILQNLWKHPVRKCEAMGIHGILFFGLKDKKQFYPTRRDEEAQWPGGGLVRNAENDRYLRSKVGSSK
jgi:hypothetical protein